MDLNRFSYYRANPYAKNNFIPVASMTNRKQKQFPSQIPQGEEHLAARPGRRIFRDKVQNNEIQKDNILNSPQRYPYENRIAMQKSYARNLDTIDIEGASSGTKVSESIRNKHKALEELRKRKQEEVKSPIFGSSLDQVYEKRRRQLADQMQKGVELRKTKDTLSQNSHDKNESSSLQNSRLSTKNIEANDPKVLQSQLQAEYQRYVSHNSNQKYHGVVPNAYEFQGFQRYRRQEGAYQTLNSYNNGRIPQHVPIQKPYQNQNDRYRSIDLTRENSSQSTTNHRGSSIDSPLMTTNTPPSNFGHQPAYMNNSFISINNRHRSNPEYIDNYSTELQKRVQQVQKNKQLEENIKSIYQNDRSEFRRHNPTNLSFNIAAKSSLMGPII